MEKKEKRARKVANYAAPQAKTLLKVAGFLDIFLTLSVAVAAFAAGFTLIYLVVWLLSGFDSGYLAVLVGLGATAIVFGVSAVTLVTMRALLEGFALVVEWFYRSLRNPYE